MAIDAIDVKGYRSIRDLYLRLGRINVLVGPNGCGKSNLYNSMYLLHAAASGRFAQAIADEGGMPSVLWAGQRTKGPVRMTLAVDVDGMEYEISCGLPAPGDPFGFFKLDPRIKEESVVFVKGAKRTPMLERGPGSVWLRDAAGKRVDFPLSMEPMESVLSQLREPHRFPQLSQLREHFLSWRFYHHFRTDPGSPMREPQVAIFTPIISHDGRDVAAAIASLGESDFQRYVARGLGGSCAHIMDDDAGRKSISLQTPGLNRDLHARELSDGTLRYLCLLAALLTPRPPSLLAFNEPETSLHPDLLEPLAELIVKASKRSQLWITTHSTALAGYIEKHSGIPPVRLEKVEGATKLVGEVFGDFVAEYK